MRYFLVLIPLFLWSCDQNKKTFLAKTKEEKVLHVNYTVQIPENTPIKLRKECQIETLQNFYRLNWEYPDYKYLINYEKSDFTHPLIDIFPRENYPRYKPTLLSLTDVSDSLSIAKIGYFTPVKEGFASMSIIYNVMLVENNRVFTLTNMLKYNTLDWQTKTVGKITYRAYLGYDFNENRMQKMVDFNQQMARFFHANPMFFTYYISPTTKKSMQIRGYDFQFHMFLSDQIGAITYTRDHLIFAGNNSEYYPHEVVHLYLHEYFPYTHRIVEDGLATYFGGSMGLPFEDHVKILKAHLAKNQIDILDTLYCQPGYVINEKTSLWYSMGAFLCHLTLEKCGKQGLIKLLDAGEENENLSLAIEELFGIEIENFNQFIRKELKNHNTITQRI